MNKQIKKWFAGLGCRKSRMRRRVYLESCTVCRKNQAKWHKGQSTRGSRQSSPSLRMCQLARMRYASESLGALRPNTISQCSYRAP
eukprot:6183916-Pleurochrysis_carterae.AAC.1